MSNPTENPTGPVVTRADGRKATDLYRTTDLDVAAIAMQVGVSRMTVYRWLRREGGSFGHQARNPSEAPIGHDVLRSSGDVAELRRQLATLTSQVGLLEGSVEAPVGLQHHQAT